MTISSLVTAPLAGGFGDAVTQSQAVFRAVMDAMARPGSVHSLSVELAPPPPLTPELAAIVLALADHEAPVWLDSVLAQAADVGAYLRFHTGARIVEAPQEAAFALVTDAVALPPFAAFAQGTDAYPDTSTTLVMAVQRLDDDEGASGAFALEGPGIAGRSHLAVAPVAADLTVRLRANRALFPRGIDCIFTAAGKIAAIPRSTVVLEEG